MADWLFMLTFACAANAFYLASRGPTEYCEEHNATNECLVSYVNVAGF